MLDVQLSYGDNTVSGHHCRNVLYAVMLCYFVLLCYVMLMLCIFRRQRVEREAEDLFQTLQNEIDKLRETIDELDLNPDLQVS